MGIPQTCATNNWRMLLPIDFKLGTLININMKIIPIARLVSRSRSFLILLPGGYVFYKHLLFKLKRLCSEEERGNCS